MAASLFRVVVCAALVVKTAGGLTLAQTSAANAPQNSVSASGAKAFEVASVRKSPPPDYQKMIEGLRQGRRPDSSRVDGSRATYTYMSLKQLIAYAYKLRIYEVSGPDWLSTDRMDIAAKLPDGATEDDAPDMMRALLEDRFKLAAHKETKDAPVLGLMLAKGGPKLTESTAPVETIDANAELQPGQSRMDTVDGPVLLVRNPDGSTTYHMGPRGTFTLKFDIETRSMRMTATGMSMRGLALMMTSLGGGEGKQVVDMTGLTGRYDVTAEFSMNDLMQSLKDQGIELPQRPGDGPDSVASDPGGGATLSSALSKMGLRMEKSHAMVQRLVVDHVEMDPTEQ
jgi:uncharacterized protein (TIGR03435 family)